ncbi:MAG: hypothetical protein ABIK20_03095 [Candidatus Omnitrophota bacterium]
MKINRFLNLPFLVLFVFTVAAISENLYAAGAAPTAIKAERIDKEDLAGIIKPTLEGYLKNHPNPQVRLWSMVLLVNIDKIDEQQLSAIPNLVVQLGNKDENIRQIALISIREALTLDQKEWKGVMGTVFRTIAKTTKYPEVKKLAIKSLGMLQDLDEESLDSLMLLFELAQDNDREIRPVATAAIVGILEKKTTGGG